MIEDRKILDLKEAKYMLESFTYEMKNGIDSYGNLEHFIDPALKGDYMANLLATEQSIYADGENAPLEDQRARLEALQAVGLPVKNRWRFRNEYEDYISQFNKYKEQAHVAMAGVAHLTDENRQLINDKIAVLEQFLLELRSTVESLPRHEDAPTNLAEIERKQIALESEVTRILSIPPPAPKKEEEKKEEEPAAEQPAAEGDVPMQEEQQPEGEAPAQ